MQLALLRPLLGEICGTLTQMRIGQLWLLQDGWSPIGHVPMSRPIGLRFQGHPIGHIQKWNRASKGIRSGTPAGGTK